MARRELRRLSLSILLPCALSVSMLELKGSGSKISMNGATLSASCSAEEPGVRALTPKAFPMFDSGFSPDSTVRRAVFVVSSI